MWTALLVTLATTVGGSAPVRVAAPNALVATAVETSNAARSLVATALVDTTPMRAATPKAARRLLADALAAADAVDSVRANRTARTVTFGIHRAHEAYELVATIAADGRVVALEIDDVVARPELGALSWLADVAHDARSIARLLVGDDGTIVIVTGDGERYEAIERRGSRTNAAAEARWAAAWDV